VSRPWIRWHHPARRPHDAERVHPGCERDEPYQGADPPCHQRSGSAMASMGGRGPPLADRGQPLHAGILSILVFQERLRRCSASGGCAVTMLKLEVTESSVVDDMKRTRTCYERLGAMGLRFSVDDFGTGYFSLAHLKRLPDRRDQIDRSFVSAMAAHEGGRGHRPLDDRPRSQPRFERGGRGGGDARCHGAPRAIGL